MKKFKFLKDHGEYKAGTVAEIPDSILSTLPAGTVEEIKETPAFDLKAFEGMLNDALARHTKENPSIRVTVVKEPADEGFKSFGEQLIAVRELHTSGKMDKRLEAIAARVKAATGLNETVDSEGGFLVQPEFSGMLFQLAFQTGLLAGECDTTEIGPNSNGLTWNAVDETSRVAGSRRGGLSTYWTSEAADYTGSKPKFATRTLRLAKLTGLYYATEELLADATALQSMVSGWFGEEFGFKMDDAILRGRGSGQPLGILNSPALIQVAKESNQAATTIVGNNVIKMFARCWAPSWPRAKWYINQDIIPQLFTMTIPTGATSYPIYMPANGVSGAPFGTLFGRPVQPIEQASTLGAVGDILLLDLSQYKLIRKGMLNAQSSIHVRFVQGETAFRFDMRVNGEPLWRLPLTPAQGSNTQSPFVTLAVRS